MKRKSKWMVDDVESSWLVKKNKEDYLNTSWSCMGELSNPYRSSPLKDKSMLVLDEADTVRYL